MKQLSLPRSGEWTDGITLSATPHRPELTLDQEWLRGVLADLPNEAHGRAALNAIRGNDAAWEALSDDERLDTRRLIRQLGEFTDADPWGKHCRHTVNRIAAEPALRTRIEVKAAAEKAAAREKERARLAAMSSEEREHERFRQSEERWRRR